MKRIPISIKIPVIDAERSGDLSVAQIVIREIGSSIERISVKVLRPLTKRNPLGHQRKFRPEIIRPGARLPVVYQPRQRKSKVNNYQKSSTNQPRLRYSVKTFQFTLAWPTLPRFANWWQRIPKKSKLIVALLMIIAVGSLVGILAGVGQSKPGINGSGSSSSGNGPPKLVRGSPSFTTILPKGKSIDQLGGWTRISPPGRNPAYVYLDKIGKTRIKVSEQPLPDSFKNNTAEKISQLAESYNASDKFTASGGTPVYVGSNGASQSVILTKDNLLILISSEGPISNDRWTAYISSLY